MNKVISIFRSLLNKRYEDAQLPPVPENIDFNDTWSDETGPDFTGLELETTIGKVVLQKCSEPTITPPSSIYSPRTSLCGVNGTKVPVTAGKPYRVLVTYVGVGKRKKQIHFFQFHCDDGSIHLVNPSDCEFLGCELKAS